MFEAEIQKGMAYLDKKHPGWESKINLETLNLREACFCVLGQLEGGFWHFLEGIVPSIAIADEDSMYFLRFAWAKERGFATGDYQMFSPSAKYRTLTQEWKAAIKKRLQEKG